MAKADDISVPQNMQAVYDEVTLAFPRKAE